MVDDQWEDPGFSVQVMQSAPVVSGEDFADQVGVFGVRLFAVVPVCQQMAACAVYRVRHGGEQACCDGVSA